MSRLIDADKLLKDMKRVCKGNCKRCEDYTILSSDLHCGLVDRQPTIQPQGIDKDRLDHAIKLLEFCKQRHIDIATDLPDTAFIEAQKVSCYEMALKVMRALLPQPTSDVPDTNDGKIQQPTSAIQGE